MQKKTSGHMGERGGDTAAVQARIRLVPRQFAWFIALPPLTCTRVELRRLQVRTAAHTAGKAGKVQTSVHCSFGGSSSRVSELGAAMPTEPASRLSSRGSFGNRLGHPLTLETKKNMLTLGFDFQPRAMSFSLCKCSHLPFSNI